MPGAEIPPGGAARGGDSPSAALVVGVVGLGRMGSAIAARLGKSFEVVGWDLRPVEVPGVTRASRAADLAASCDVIVSSLPSSAETRQLLLEPSFREAFAESGAVVADASTSQPSAMRELARDLGGTSARLLDTPILGRPESCGSWTMPVGGEPSAFERAAPVLEKVAPRLFHVGELGAGHSIKLLNNMMFAAINVITAEAVGACDRVGVDPRKFVEIVGGSAAATVSPLFKSLAPRMLGEDLETVFTVSLLDKDLRLAVSMCQEAGALLIAAPALAGATAKALEMGLDQADSSALIEVYRRRDPM